MLLQPLCIRLIDSQTKMKNIVVMSSRSNWGLRFERSDDASTRQHVNASTHRRVDASGETPNIGLLLILVNFQSECGCGHSRIRSLIRSSLVCSFIRSFVHSLVRSFVPSLARSFGRSFIS